MSESPVLVTGAAGFVGVPTVQRLLEAGQPVVALDNYAVAGPDALAALAESPLLEVVEADVRDADALRDVCRQWAPKVVIHLAAMHFIPYCNAHPDETLAVNTVGLQNMLLAIEDPHEARFVFTSTGAIYTPALDPHREDSPALPMDVYGASKLVGEWLLEFQRAKTPGFSPRVARLFNVYGPGETNRHVLPDILGHTRRGDDLPLGNVEPKRDYVYVDDVADVLVGLLDGPEPPGPVNVGTGSSYSVVELVDTLRGITGRPLRILTDPERVRKSDRPNLQADTSRLRELFPWYMPISLEEGLRRTLAAELPWLAMATRSLYSHVCHGNPEAGAKSTPSVRSRHMKRALVTGITGQDGLYLAEFLLSQGYEVSGMVRGQSNPRGEKVREIVPAVELIEGDLGDMASLINVVEQVQPDEVYNLGAISFVGLSFKQPELTANVTGLGVLRMLEAIRVVAGAQNNPIRFYQASSSEMFGRVRETPQNELTPLHPRSPYGVAKIFGHNITVNYRESYGIHACAGILFNHESPRRGLEFVTRKITNAIARIKLGLQDHIVLGNLDAERDWGFAGEYVEAMWMILQQDKPDDYVIATGETHSVREFLDIAFATVGIDDWAPYVRQDPRFMRPADVDLLVGDAGKARAQLGWKPSVGFEQLVHMMMESDLALEERKLLEAGA